MSPKGSRGKKSCEAKVTFQGPFGKETPVASQTECLFLLRSDDAVASQVRTSSGLARW